MENKHLYIKQLDENLNKYQVLAQNSDPKSGWIMAIRKALGISVQQLAGRLGISRNSIYAMEQREQEGAITLNALREAAMAMDMNLVYGFVPKDGSIEALIDRKAREMAIKIVARTSQSMTLENQEVSKKRIKESIDERTMQIKRELPKAIWD